MLSTKRSVNDLRNELARAVCRNIVVTSRTNGEKIVWSIGTSVSFRVYVVKLTCNTLKAPTTQSSSILRSGGHMNIVPPVINDVKMKLEINKIIDNLTIRSEI
jgi:hypothetical protein